MELVLLIEDDNDIRETTLEFLEMENFEGIGFPSGLEALDYLSAPASRLPALIITDMNMPRMDGPTFRAAQLALPLIKQIPCVVLSADLRVQDRFENLKLAGVVQKPVDLDQLARVVRTAIYQNSAQAAAANSAVSVDSSSRTAKISEIRIHDVINEIGAAKMHAEVLADDPSLTADARHRLQRIDEKLDLAIRILRDDSGDSI